MIQELLFTIEYESKCESVSVDVKAPEEFFKTLDKLNMEGNYLPEQIFRMNEIFLFWKLITERTFIH